MLKYNFSKNIKEYILALVGSYKALFIGLVGGYLGTLINLPLPWLLGSLGLNLCFAFTNFKIVFPTKLLNPIFLIVGIILGGTLNVTLLYKIHLWIFSSLAMLICTMVSTILAGCYFFKVLFLLIICFIFANILKNYKIPSPTLVGAMALSGAFYTFEIINARFPDAFINIAFIFLGTALGTRLNGLKIKELLFFIFHGIVVSSILVIVAMITAYLLTYIGFEFIPTFLSFAPGGIHEMVVISVAYNIDPIFVSYHHFLRIFIIVLFLPFLLSKFRKTN